MSETLREANEKLVPFWRTYYRLLDWADDDGLPDPDKVDAAHWMLDLYDAIKNGCIHDEREARRAMDAINAGRPRIYPLGAKP